MLKNHLNRLFIDAFSFVPTEGQRVLFDKVALFIAGEESFSIMIVNGYAGTGKLRLLALLFACLNH